MNFDDIQKLWQQQEDKAVFSINDYVLREVLARKRQEFSKKFLYRKVADYVAGALVILAVVFIFLVMWSADGPKTFGHFVSIIMAGAAGFFWLTWTWLQRKRHRLADRQYTASVTQEITRGITELDFEIALRTDVAKLLAASVPLPLSALLLAWAMFSVNADSSNFILFAVCFTTLYSVYNKFKAAQLEVITYFLPRKQELEQLRAKLGQ
jgi:Na+/melibiose symporter-like transporter